MKCLLLLFLISATLSHKLPDSVKLCHQSDPNFSRCVAKNMKEGLVTFKNGNKDLGVPLLEPFSVERIEIMPPSNGKAVNLHMIFTDVLIYGMTTLDVNYMDIDFDKNCNWIMDIISPSVVLKGNYVMNGKLLIFPLNAHGNCTITQNKFHNTHKMWCKKYVKNGKTHIKITNHTMDMRPEEMIYNFTDLFPLNKQIEDQILQTMNENSISLFEEIKDSFERIFSSIYMQVGNQVLSRVPFDEIFLP